MQAVDVRCFNPDLLSLTKISKDTQLNTDSENNSDVSITVMKTYSPFYDEKDFYIKLSKLKREKLEEYLTPDNFIDFNLKELEELKSGLRMIEQFPRKHLLNWSISHNSKVITDLLKDVSNIYSCRLVSKVTKFLTIDEVDICIYRSFTTTNTNRIVEGSIELSHAEDIVIVIDRDNFDISKLKITDNKITYDGYNFVVKGDDKTTVEVKKINKPESYNDWYLCKFEVTDGVLSEIQKWILSQGQYDPLLENGIFETLVSSNVFCYEGDFLCTPYLKINTVEGYTSIASKVVQMVDTVPYYDKV